MLEPPRPFLTVCLAAALLLVPHVTLARDLAEFCTSGVIRQPGVPYANFVTGAGDGLDVALIQGFVRHRGVRYAFVLGSSATVFGDLTGLRADGSYQAMVKKVCPAVFDRCPGIYASAS